MRKMRQVRMWRLIGISIASLSAVLATACGGSSESVGTATATSVPRGATEEPATATQPANVAQPTATTASAPAAKPSADGPAGKLVIATSDSGPASYDIFSNQYPYSARNVQLGIMEPLWYQDDKFDYVPRVASSWELDSDNMGVTVHIDPQAEFHGGWGPVTAEDVKFTFERGSADKSKFTAASRINNVFSSYEVIDDKTLHITFSKLNIEWLQIGSDGSFQVQSKTYFDEKGAEYVNLNAIGTGPFKVTEQLADDHINLAAVNDHYRATPNVAEIVVFEQPELAARIASLSTGEADIIEGAVTVADRIKEISGVRLVTGNALGERGVTINFAGLWYSPVDRNGNPVERDLHTEEPWIGDPGDPASMEAATDVRWAMSYALDRKGIADVIVGELGGPMYAYGTTEAAPWWDPKWVIPYDTGKAKSKLADAGYPDGFNFNFWWNTGWGDTYDQVVESLFPMWEEIGVRPVVNKSPYTTRRPETLARTIHDVWSYIHGANQNTLESASTALSAYFTAESFWTPGMEFPEMQDLADRMDDAVPDREEMTHVTHDYVNYLWEQQGLVPVALWRDPYGVGPRVSDSWQPGKHSQWPQDLETLRLN